MVRVSGTDAYLHRGIGAVAVGARVLAGLGYQVIVASAERVQLIAESRLKNDRVGPETLARLVPWNRRRVALSAIATRTLARISHR